MVLAAVAATKAGDGLTGGATGLTGAAQLTYRSKGLKLLGLLAPPLPMLPLPWAQVSPLPMLLLPKVQMLLLPTLPPPQATVVPPTSE